jgi:hypothetical protein
MHAWLEALSRGDDQNVAAMAVTALQIQEEIQVAADSLKRRATVVQYLVLCEALLSATGWHRPPPWS